MNKLSRQSVSNFDHESIFDAELIIRTDKGVFSLVGKQSSQELKKAPEPERTNISHSCDCWKALHKGSQG